MARKKGDPNKTKALEILANGPMFEDALLDKIHVHRSYPKSTITQGLISAGLVHVNRDGKLQLTKRREPVKRYKEDEGDCLPETYHSVMGGVFA